MIGICGLNNAFSQDLNIVEIDSSKPATLGWDYTLPDLNVEGFNIYKEKTVNGITIYELIGSILIPLISTDLNFDLPSPAIGSYLVTAYNGLFESPYSEKIIVVEAAPPLKEPFPPTNLRVIQISP